MTLVPCEHCGQRVGVFSTRPHRHGLRQDGPRRLVRHKHTVALGRFTRVDWCPGKFERQEADR
jgi:hypothetical protein